MWRFFSIVIFSFVAFEVRAEVSATVVREATPTLSGQGNVVFTPNQAGYYSWRVFRSDGTQSGSTFRYIAEGASWSFSYSIPSTQPTPTLELRIQWQQNLTYVPYNTYPLPNSFSDAEESSGSYYFELGPEYAGTRVDVTNQWGEVVQSVVVGENGAILSGEFVGRDGEAPEFTAEFFRPVIEGGDGSGWSSAGEVNIGSQPSGQAGPSSQSSSTWTIQNNNVAPVGTTYTQGGNTYVSNGGGSWTVTNSGGSSSSSSSVTTYHEYVTNISNVYGGGQYYVTNQNGGVVGQGSVPSGGGSVTLSVNLLPGESVANVYVQPIVVGGDGTPALGTPINLGPPTNGGGPMPTPTPPPSPQPTPTPVPSPSPLPTPVPSAPPVGGGDVGVQPSDPDETVSLPEDDEIDFDPDDGEEQILEQAQGIAETWGQIANKLGELQSALAGFADLFNAGYFDAGDPGTQCTIQMGRASIDLNPYSQYRAATAAFAYGLGAMVVFSLVNSALRR